jgi:hypothetical protein
MKSKGIKDSQLSSRVFQVQRLFYSTSILRTDATKLKLLDNFTNWNATGGYNSNFPVKS